MSSSPPITPSDIKAYASWMALVKCHHKWQNVMNSKLASLNLTAAQHELMINVRQNPGMTQQQLSERMHVVKSNISALIKKLTMRHFIEQRNCQTDGRIHRLFLTPIGAEQLDRSMVIQIEVIKHMTAVLSDAEIQVNCELMNRIYNALDHSS